MFTKLFVKSEKTPIISHASLSEIRHHIAVPERQRGERTQIVIKLYISSQNAI